MLKIGVLGAGHLGSIHLNILKNIDCFELIGFYDPDYDLSKRKEKELGIRFIDSAEQLIDECDAVDIVTPTVSHFDCAKQALTKSKHIFIEKPITNTLDEAKTLIELSQEANVKVQVGHVERFNPAFLAAKGNIQTPMFIETHRLAQFNPRGTDVSVVLDLMIHDIDIVLSLVNSNIKKISASGVAVISDTPDITNARLEFDNGCVANLTASRISMKNMRKSRFFQKDAYVSVDFLDKQVEIVKIKNIEEAPDPLAVIIDPGKGKKPKQIYFESPNIVSSNAIEEELRSFANSIQNESSAVVSIEDGYKALDVANQILNKLNGTPALFQE